MKKSSFVTAILAAMMMIAPSKMSAHFPAGVHSMYIGEVVNAWKKLHYCYWSFCPQWQYTD